MSGKVQEALNAGKKNVSFPTDMPTLREASLGWIVSTHELVASQPQLIRNVSIHPLLHWHILTFYNLGMEKL